MSSFRGRNARQSGRLTPLPHDEEYDEESSSTHLKTPSTPKAPDSLRQVDTSPIKSNTRVRTLYTKGVQPRSEGHTWPLVIYSCVAHVSIQYFNCFWGKKKLIINKIKNVSLHSIMNKCIFIIFINEKPNILL